MFCKTELMLFGFTAKVDRWEDTGFISTPDSSTDDSDAVMSFLASVSSIFDPQAQHEDSYLF